MPRFDGDPVFHALLDPADAPDGSVGVELEGFARSEQDYEPGTAIVRTRLFDPQARASRSPTSRRASSTATAFSGRRSWFAACARWRASARAHHRAAARRVGRGDAR